MARGSGGYHLYQLYNYINRGGIFKCDFRKQSGFWGELSENSYRDAFRSFTIFYVIGAIIHYVETFHSAKRANKMLNDILEKEEQV